MSFYFAGQLVVIQGDLQEDYAYTVVELLAMTGTLEQQVVPEIQTILDQFPEVFAVPV